MPCISVRILPGFWAPSKGRRMLLPTWAYGLGIRGHPSRVGQADNSPPHYTMSHWSFHYVNTYKHWPSMVLQSNSPRTASPGLARGTSECLSIYSCCPPASRKAPGSLRGTPGSDPESDPRDKITNPFLCICKAQFSDLSIGNETIYYPHKVVSEDLKRPQKVKFFFIINILASTYYMLGPLTHHLNESILDTHVRNKSKNAGDGVKK